MTAQAGRFRLRVAAMPRTLTWPAPVQLVDP